MAFLRRGGKEEGRERGRTRTDVTTRGGKRERKRERRLVPPSQEESGGVGRVLGKEGDSPSKSKKTLVKLAAEEEKRRGDLSILKKKEGTGSVERREGERGQTHTNPPKGEEAKPKGGRGGMTSVRERRASSTGTRVVFSGTKDRLNREEGLKIFGGKRGKFLIFP